MAAAAAAAAAAESFQSCPTLCDPIDHVVPTAWQDEALAHHGVSREVPCSSLKGETVPDSLHATPKSPPNPVGEGTKRRGTDTPMHLLETPAGSTHSLSRALTLLYHAAGAGLQECSVTALRLALGKPWGPADGRDRLESTARSPGSGALLRHQWDSEI